MSNETIHINNFGLFVEALRPVSKISTSARIDVGDIGSTICISNETCRCEINTNAITATEPTTISVADVSSLIKVLSSVENIHNGDYSNVKITVDGGFLKINSKKFKTKLSMIDPDKIAGNVGQKFKSDLRLLPADYKFTTNSNFIKRLNNHTFMFSDSKALRVYLRGEPGMNNNTVFATIGDESNDFENSVTFEFGMLTDGSLENANVILDFAGLNNLNIMQSDEIVIHKPTGRNTIFAFVNKTVDNSFIDMTLVDMILVK